MEGRLFRYGNSMPIAAIAQLEERRKPELNRRHPDYETGARLLRIKEQYPDAVLYFVSDGDWAGCPLEWKAFVNYGLRLYGKDPNDERYTRFHTCRMVKAGFVPVRLSGKHRFYFDSPESQTAFFLTWQGDYDYD